MRRIAIGVQEADGDRLHPVGRQLPRRRPHRIEIQRHDGIAITVHPLRHFKPAAARHQRIGILQEQIVNIVALLSAHFEHVAKALGGDQPELRAPAFDQRVGDQGRAMHDIADIAKRDARARHQLGKPRERADRRIIRRGQAFMQPNGILPRVQQDEIGKGTPDIKSDPPPCRHRPAPCLSPASLSPAAIGWPVGNYCSRSASGRANAVAACVIMQPLFHVL